jgi:hypothetical protein
MEDQSPSGRLGPSRGTVSAPVAWLHRGRRVRPSPGRKSRWGRPNRAAGRVPQLQLAGGQPLGPRPGSTTNHEMVIMTTARCRYCGQEIIFALVIKSKRRIPIDPTPYPADYADANVAVSRDHLGSVFARVLSRGETPRPSERRAMPHFATCNPLPGVRGRNGRVRRSERHTGPPRAHTPQKGK